MAGQRFLFAVVMSHSNTDGGLTILQATVSKNGSCVADSGTRSNALNVQIWRKMKMFVVRQLANQGLNIMESTLGTIHNLKDNLALLASMDDSVLTLVNNADVTQFYGRTKPLKVAYGDRRFRTSVRRL